MFDILHIMTYAYVMENVLLKRNEDLDDIFGVCDYLQEAEGRSGPSSIITMVRQSDLYKQTLLKVGKPTSDCSTKTTISNKMGG